MSYESPTTSPLVTTRNWDRFAPRNRRGFAGRIFAEDPPSLEQYKGRPGIELIRDINEIKERIEERERKGQTNRDKAMALGFHGKNQLRTNYCWCTALVQGMEWHRMMQGEPRVSLSVASVACHIKNFRNVGGWASQAIPHLTEKGATPVELWPDFAIDRRYDTPEARAAALPYRLEKYHDITDDDYDDTFLWCLSYMLNDRLVAGGYSFMGHEILLCDPKIMRGGIGIEGINSYWPLNGERRGGDFMTIEPRLATPGDAVAVITTTSTGAN